MYITSECNRWTIMSKFVAMIFYLWLSFSLSEAQPLKIDVFALINDACLHCHDSYTQTELNFENLSEDLIQSETFRQQHGALLLPKFFFNMNSHVHVVTDT